MNAILQCLAYCPPLAQLLLLSSGGGRGGATLAGEEGGGVEEEEKVWGGRLSPTVGSGTGKATAASAASVFDVASVLCDIVAQLHGVVVPSSAAPSSSSSGGGGGSSGTAFSTVAPVATTSSSPSSSGGGGGSGGGTSVSPKVLVSNILALGKQFRIGRQEDAHEFLVGCDQPSSKTVLKRWRRSTTLVV